MTIAKLRADQLKRINTNPTRVYWQEAGLIDNGYGTMIPNPHAGHDAVTYYADNVMIANMGSSISEEKGAVMPFGYAQPLLLTTVWDAEWLNNGMILSYNTRLYRVDDVLPVRYKGDVISKIAKLTDVTGKTNDIVVLGAVEWTEDGEEEVVVIGG